MSRKHKNKLTEDQGQFDPLENLTPPAEEPAPDQVSDEQPETPEESPAPEPKPKKPNGFMSMLSEANERRKARIKKYQDGKREA